MFRSAFLPTGFCLVLLCLMQAVAFGQTDELVAARKLQASGNFQKALDILNSELARDPEDGGAWFTYAQVQYALFEQSEATDERVAALKEVIRGYEQTIRFQDSESRPYAVARSSLIALQPKFLDDGIKLYNSRSYEAAVQQFTFAHIAEPTDTVALIYGVNAANQGQYFEDAYGFYDKLNQIKPKATYYQNMYTLQKERLKDVEKALATLKVAQSNFPDNYTFQKYEIDLLIEMNRKDEALVLLTSLAKVYPANMSIVLNRTLLLDEAFKKNKNQLDSAQFGESVDRLISSYKDVLALSPRNLLANFNLAVLYSDKANTYIKALNGMNASGFALYNEAYQEKSKEALKEAVLYMEAARNSQPKNLNILNALKLFYDKLDMDEKREAIEQQIQALGN